MLTQFSRTELLLGKEAMEKLQNSRVAVLSVRRWHEAALEPLI